MKSLLISNITFLILLLCVSCSDRNGNNADIVLTDAESLIERGEYGRAVELCNSVTNGADSASMSWRNYCRAAAIYGIAYDHDIDTEASMAAAAKCIERARALQPDSIASFINSIAPEYATGFHTVIQTLDALNTDRSNIGDHEEDMAPEHELSE